MKYKKLLLSSQRCKSLIYSLHARGHNVTVLSADVEESKQNLTFLHLNEVYPSIYNGEDDPDFFEYNKLGPLNLFLMYADISKKACIGSLNSNGYKQLLNYPSDFKIDVVINDITMDPCLLGILHKFKVPSIIGVSPFHSPGQFGANLIYPAFAPGHDVLYPSRMNFQQRATSAFVHLLEHFMRLYYFTPLVDGIVRKAHPNAPYLGDTQQKFKMYLINNDPIVDYKQPIFANQKNVGGLQIKNPKELPSDLKTIADNAKDGLILFSLGTNVRSDKLGVETITKILITFGRLSKYTFLWKFETKESLPIDLPKNVKIQEWMPQSDILAHKNTKLFMSHCGLLSIQEALWYGVPILGFPVFGDQPQNALRMKELGVSETVSILDVTEQELYDSLKNMLENPKYSQEIGKISQALRDKPMTPLEEATYWTEWLIRNPDIDLEGAAADLNLFERHSLDVYTVLILAELLFIYIFVKLAICIVKLLFCKRKNSSKNDLSKKLN